MSEKKYIVSYPDLLEEWDWAKNNEISIQPDSISIGSMKKVHWKCTLGHHWEANPNNRSRGQGCPFCAGKRVLAGFNDLQSQVPKVAEEWHPNKNEDLLPSEITCGSNKRVWWQCRTCGNEWQTSVANRVRGTDCPVCGKIKQGQAKVKKHIVENGSLANRYPKLLEEWDYDLNDISPQAVSVHSHRRIWWKCENCNHSWGTTVYHRTVRNSGCPACANKTTTLDNCLATTHPDILKKWNYEKNTDITPQDVTAGSSRKKVWWICDKGHEWESTVTAIVNGGICPICCNQKVLPGYNDLATTNPELAAEWHPTKNGDLLPTQFTAGSSRTKIWWLCSRGHEYEARIANRSHGTGCPICDKERKTSFPEQAIFYYLGKVTAAKSRYLFGGTTEIDVYLPDYQVGIEYDGHYYHASPEARMKEQKKDALLLINGITIIRVKEVKNTPAFQDDDKTIYCHNAGNYLYLKDVIQKIIKRIPIRSNCCVDLDIDIKRDAAAIMSQYIQSEKENSLAAKYPELAAEWHHTRNGFISPDMVSYASGKKVWWLGSCGHEWLSSVDSRIKGTNCPICANKMVLEGYNDLETTQPQLAKEWDYTRNGSVSPKMFTYGSDKKVWWICANGHSYQATISNRYYGKNCPYCSNTKVLKDYNDLASQFPEIAEEWNYSKNRETPEQVLPGSNKKIWWKCHTCGHEWIAQPNHRVYRHSGCPACSGRVATPEENLFIVNPKLCKEWNVARNKKTPSDYRPQSSQKVWWLCSSCGYEWRAKISERSKGTGCPCCAGKKVIKGTNDLATMHPELVPEWNFEKNTFLSPDTITAGTNIKVWWTCSACGHEWQSSVSNRSHGRGCPVCARKATTESKEKSIYQYDSYGSFIKEYKSIKDAKKDTGLKTICPSSQEKKTAGGFIWLLEQDDARAIEIASTINQSRTVYKHLPVLQYSIDGSFIKRYPSSGDAEKENGIAQSKVGACCRGKRKTAGGYVWKYDISE